MPTLDTSGAFPIAIGDSIGITDGQTIPFDSQALTNIFDFPIEITSMTITMMTPSETTTGRPWMFSYYMQLSARLGDSIITDSVDGFVPVWNFGKPKQVQYEAANDSAGRLRNTHTWVFSDSIIIPPTMGFVVNLKRRPIPTQMVATATSIFSTLAFTGRALPNAKMPKEINVPYISSYEWASAVTNAVNDEQTLRNPFSIPLRANYLNGRIFDLGTSILVERQYDSTALANITTNFPKNGTAGDSVQITQAAGQGVPFYDAFEFHNRALHVDMNLKPREGFKVQLSGKQGSTAVTVALLGSRKEQF